MSASRTPTRAPSCARARARFAETVDLPTPPLPEETAIRFFTPGMTRCVPWTLWAMMFCRTSAVTRSTPSAFTASSIERLTLSAAKRAG